MKIFGLIFFVLFINSMLIAKNQKLNIDLSSKGNDIAFDIESIQVPFGQDINIQFTNKAKPDSEIVHNIAILKPGSLDKVLEYFEKIDYDLEKMKKFDSVLAMTPSLDPGKSVSLKLTKKMLSKPGYYPYICLIPGHADMLGMKGLMHVK